MKTIDCGRCGSDDVRLEDGVYRCANCGKQYTVSDAEQRSAALEKLNRKRKWQIILMAGCMICLVIAALLLPGYAEDGSHAAQIYAATAGSTGFFVAALVIRILFGRDRKNLYPGK